MKHKEQCEYVDRDRTQRQYKTALTGALKIHARKTTRQNKFKFSSSMLKAGYSWRSNNIIRKRIPCIYNMIAEK